MLILTEKPSVAKDIAIGLGGYTLSNGVWRKGSDTIVAAHGHLLELLMPEDYDASLKAWKMDTLPIVPQPMRYKPIADPSNALKKIGDALRAHGTAGFILATDAEREGELIGAIIMDYLDFGSTAGARRFWVSEALTPEVVRRGIAEAKPLSDYECYKKAGYARQHADWLIGINISRVIGIQTGMTGGSFGRVQTAVLGAIYARDKAIANFKSEPYTVIDVTADKDGRQFRMSAAIGGKSKFAQNGDEAARVLAAIKQGGTVTVSSARTERRSENPPQLFNITGLQKHCSQKFKMSPAKTLETAQALYEKLKCLSYPRTPSTVLGDDNVEMFRDKFDLLKTVYPSLAAGCDEASISGANKRVFNTAKLRDHHALIPLAELPNEASNDEKNVYMSVLERFFQTIKKPFTYDATTITAEKDDVTLTANGRHVIEQGWKERLPHDEVDGDKDESENQQDLPPVSEGDTLAIAAVKSLEKMTKPKKHYTNATLLSLMENPKGEGDESFGGKMAGLGTPATRADIIQTLLKRGYVTEDKQSLVITKKGEFLIDAVKTVPSLAKMLSLSTTTEWEQTLQDDPEKFISEIRQFIKNEVPQMKISARWQKDGIGKCPVCKDGNVIESKMSYSCDRYRDGCKFAIWKETMGARVSADDAKILLAGGKTKPKQMTSKAGTKFFASLVIKDGRLERVFENGGRQKKQ